jgi:ABC-type Fe3+-hydroxamate transport system substrate-binding protein
MTRVDGRGRALQVPRPPERIVSLVPSTTETLFSLGLGDRVVGITRFCVHPKDHLQAIPKVGGTKDVDVDRVRALRPDLILGNCEENTREIFEALDDLPLWASFPRDVDGALEDLVALGGLTGTELAAEALVSTISDRRASLRSAVTSAGLFRFVYLIWRRPWMRAGPDTFIARLLAEAGGIEALGPAEARFPTVSPTELRGVDLVLLSSEPFPFRARHVHELVEQGVPADRIRFVDGELCSWHGARMAFSFPALQAWITQGFPLEPGPPLEG